MAADEKGRPKVSIAALKTRPFERNVALTWLGVGAGAKIMAHSVANIFRGEISRDSADREFYERQARILADELGKLKGSVMKAGQMLSLYGQYFLPEEAVTVLSQLQDDTPPVAWSVVAPVLERNIGPQRLAELEVDRRAMAAASLGQVHRARRKTDGRDLCVKIQYPGVADAIDSDTNTLSRLLSMTRLAPKGMDLTPVFEEVREMLYREVDYKAEARFTRRFAAKLKGDPRFVVPEVIEEYSTAQVLTTTYEANCSVRDPQVQNLSLARRNRLGMAFLELFLEEFFRWGMVQSDPHFGNYRFRIGAAEADDRIVLFDFGATRVFRRSFVRGYCDIVEGSLRRDRDQVLRGAIAIGLMDERMPESGIEGFAQMCQSIVEPFEAQDDPRADRALRNAEGAYRWGDSDLPMRTGRMAAVNAMSVNFRVPPRELIFLHRRLAGVFIMLATLRCEIDGRAAVLAALRDARALLETVTDPAAGD